MDEKTWIVGKDAVLEDTIAHLRSQLQAHGFNPVEISSHNPIPHVWSVQLEDADCPLCRASGMGTSRDAALASAMGQFMERLACNYFFTSFYLGASNPDFNFYHHPKERWYPSDSHWPRGLIDDPVLQAHYNPEGSLTPAHLVDTNSYDKDRGVCSLPYKRLSDGQTQWFPINLIGNLYDSNGMAAGNTLEEARVQALSEVLERHVKFRVVAEGISLPELPDEVLARHPHILESLDTLRTRGLTVHVRDASLGGRYPVIAISLLNPDNGSCAASFGAHPRFEVALSRALTELLQGRDLEQSGRFHVPSFDQEEVASDDNLEAHFINSSGLLPWHFFKDSPDNNFVDWDHGGETSAEYEWICSVFAEDAKPIYLAEYEHLGFYVCRTIVPGLSEIYPTDNLEWDNHNASAPWRGVLLNLHHSDNDQLQALSDWLDEQDSGEDQTVAHLTGIVPDPDSPWEALRVGHLRLWLALALQELDDLPELCQWAVDFGEANEQDVRLYRCIAMLDAFRENDHDIALYQTSVSALYPGEMLRLAKSLYEGSVKFPGLHDPGPEFVDLKRHRSLIQAFDKLRVAMLRQTKPTADTT